MMMTRRRRTVKRKDSRNVTLSVESESNAVDEHSPTSSKRQKVVVEKRLRRFRSTATSAIEARIDRALHQRLYLLAATKSSNGSIFREFKVLGNTGNVYTVEISHIPSCTCPDYAKGHLCKHIIFVLHRVLKVNRHSQLLYQQALLTNELNEIFTNADRQNNNFRFLAEQSILDAYHAKAGDSNIPKDEKSIQQKAITKDDECPICFESMINDQNNLVFCSTSCGNHIHKHCFEQWQQAKLSMRESVTCPFCRVEWKTKIEQTSNNSRNGYLNLAAYSTTHDYDYDDDDYHEWMHYRYRFY